MMTMREERKKKRKKETDHCDDCEEEKGGIETLTLILEQRLTFFQKHVLFEVKKRELRIAQLAS